MDLCSTFKPMDEWSCCSNCKINQGQINSFSRDRLFKEEDLWTYLNEVDAVLNNRPLTSISDDVTDLEPLTPNHFLIGRGNPNLDSTRQMKLMSTFGNSRTQYKPRLLCSGSNGYKNNYLYQHNDKNGEHRFTILNEEI